MDHDEQLLAGGNVSSGVVRVGDTVRRPVGPWTPAVHTLLRHLEHVGFHPAPRVLGIDERGREILTYMPGVSLAFEATDVLATTEAMVTAGALVASYHQAVASFDPPPAARWWPGTTVERPGTDRAARRLAPWNAVVDGHRWSLIEWDTVPVNRCGRPPTAWLRSWASGPSRAVPTTRSPQAGE